MIPLSIKKGAGNLTLPIKNKRASSSWTPLAVSYPAATNHENGGRSVHLPGENQTEAATSESPHKGQIKRRQLYRVVQLGLKFDPKTHYEGIKNRDIRIKPY